MLNPPAKLRRLCDANQLSSVSLLSDQSGKLLFLLAWQWPIAFALIETDSSAEAAAFAALRLIQGPWTTLDLFGSLSSCASLEPFGLNPHVMLDHASACSRISQIVTCKQTGMAMTVPCMHAGTQPGSQAEAHSWHH